MVFVYFNVWFKNSFDIVGKYNVVVSIYFILYLLLVFVLYNRDGYKKYSKIVGNVLLVVFSDIEIKNFMNSNYRYD